jgi:hypothetical protein
MFFHIMVGQNPKKSNPKKVRFLISYNVRLEYICAKKKVSQCIKKCKYIQKMIEMFFFFFWKFVAFAKDCDSI